MAINDTTLANMEREARKFYVSGFESQMPWWERITSTIILDDPNETTYTEGEAFGLTTFSAQVPSPTPIALDAARASITASVFEQTLQFTDQEWRQNQFTIGKKIQKLGRLAMETVGEALYDALATVDTTAHPLNGGGVVTANGGGTAFCADSFDIVTPNAGTISAQANFATTAFSGTALTAAITTRHAFKDMSGQRIPGNQMAGFLLHPINIIDDVNTVIQTGGVIYDGSGLVPDRNSMLAGTMVLPAQGAGGTAVDANDWFLWFSEVNEYDTGTELVGPLRPWIAQMPKVRVAESTTSNHMNIIASIEYGIWYDLDIGTKLMMRGVA